MSSLIKTAKAAIANRTGEYERNEINPPASSPSLIADVAPISCAETKETKETKEPGQYLGSELYYKIDALYRQACRTQEAAKIDGDASLMIMAKQVLASIKAYDDALMKSWEDGDRWRAANASRLMEQIAILADPPLQGKRLETAILETFPGAIIQEAS